MLLWPAFFYNNFMPVYSKKRSFLHKTLLGACSLLLLAGQFNALAANNSDRNNLNKLKTNEQKIKQLEQKTKIIKQKEAKTKETISDIQQDLEKAARQLEVANRRYEAIHKEVENVTESLISAEGKFENQLNASQDRLRRMYKFRQYTQINQLMEAQNLSGMIRRVGYFRYLARQDEDLLDSLKAEREKLSKLQYQQMLKRQIQGKQAQEQAEAKEKHAFEKKKEESYLKQLTKDRLYYEREMRALERESQRIADMLRRRYAKQSTASFNVQLGTGRFINPVSGYPMTSRFGYRVHPIFGTRKMHTGVDFGAPAGTQIRAADTGVVISAGWLGGYGKAVIVDHGKGIVTLYAHTSAFYVQPGQSVRKGQVIAAVGSTGYSTGPHLHLEVRRNGNPVDPLAWF